MLLAFEISTLHRADFILSFTLGNPRIQVSCPVNQEPVSKFFIRRPKTSFLSVPQHLQPHVIPHFPQAEKWLLGKWPGTSHSSGQRAWVVISALLPLCCVLLNSLIFSPRASISSSGECHTLSEAFPKQVPLPHLN